MDWNKLPKWAEAKLQVEDQLSPLGFKESASHDSGMLKRTEWVRDGMMFLLISEKNFYHCNVSMDSATNEHDLMDLLRFLMKDPGALELELKEADLFGTLPPKRCVDLFVEHLELIEQHLAKPDSD